MTPERPLAVFLMGPTASGKTDIAVELAQRLPFEIVSVDSAMVYRGMDIGTAKPAQDVLARAPHRLIDILDPAQPYSAARFRADALREMADIAAGRRIPLLVGGTGLYFRSLERGLSLLPSADAEVRRHLSTEAERHGWPALHARLRRVDSDSAARIHPNDPQRIQRALEVYELTGRPMTAMLAQRDGQGLPYRLIKLAVVPPDRQVLHGRIAGRFQEMLRRGLVDEVAALRARGDLDSGMPSMRAVGYRQVWEYLDGRRDREDMAERGIIATRQLAKRQLTWLRRERGMAYFDSTDHRVCNKVLKYLDSALDRA